MPCPALPTGKVAQQTKEERHIRPLVCCQTTGNKAGEQLVVAFTVRWNASPPVSLQACDPAAKLECNRRPGASPFLQAVLYLRYNGTSAIRDRTRFPLARDSAGSCLSVKKKKKSSTRAVKLPFLL
jgi:hypothetical protein